MPSVANIHKALARKKQLREEKLAKGEKPTQASRLTPTGFTDLKDRWNIPLAEFCQRAGLGPTALRRAQRQGLVVTPVGANRFVRQADWESYLAQQAEAERTRLAAKG